LSITAIGLLGFVELRDDIIAGCKLGFLGTDGNDDPTYVTSDLVRVPEERITRSQGAGENANRQYEAIILGELRRRPPVASSNMNVIMVDFAKTYRNGILHSLRDNIFRRGGDVLFLLKNVASR
jgi:hypothetical protein